MTYPIECNGCHGTGKVHSPYAPPGEWHKCPSCEGAGKHRPLIRSATAVDAERYRWLKANATHIAFADCIVVTQTRHCLDASIDKQICAAAEQEGK